ncbi:MAG TPA: DUF4142 domain-containing protein [Tepidisphaeraceae bacterium]|jgi:putative membrane protein|nr:DUF4142 domain-containing protein [Tepidisphaeraceae bacterium]
MNSRTHTIVTLAAATLLGGGVLAMGANPDQPGQPAPANQPMAQQVRPANQEVDRQVIDELQQFTRDAKTAPDKMFVLTGYMSSTMEIQMAQQALGKTQNAQIQRLANHLIKDHERLDSQFERVAQQLSVELPQGTPELAKAQLDALGSLPGHEYEVQLLATLDASHEEAIACFQATAANSKDAQVKHLANEFAPILQQHLAMVQQTASALGVNLGQSEAAPAAAHIPGAKGNKLNPGSGGPQNPVR